MGKVESMEIKKRTVYELFNNVDHQCAIRVAKGIGVGPPPEETIKNHGRRDSRLSLENRTANTIKSRKVAILAENGYNHSQLTEVKKALEKEEARSEERRVGRERRDRKER